MTRIAIITHQHDDFHQSTYFLKEFADIWKESGLDVKVLKGTADKGNADLGILHVNLTEIPDDYLQFAKTFPRVINGSVKDISKRTISSNMIAPGESVEGQVIVKTNCNFGGWPEARLKEKTADLKTKFKSKLTNLLKLNPQKIEKQWENLSSIASGEYPVFDSIEEVPQAVWDNPNLVVERFLAERKDDLYCLRIWIFFGDRETNSVCYSKEKVVKSANIIERVKTPEIPDDLRKIRQDLGFEFGKFDYAIVDGKAVLFDANRTPTLSSLSRQQSMPMLRDLASGINGFL